MEDDASLKQCLVILELAERLSANDPELAALYAGGAPAGGEAGA
jgi:malyl-CoA/(S)-citramalyl-CoA lyase